MENKSEKDMSTPKSVDLKGKRAYSLLEEVRNSMKKSRRIITVLSVLLVLAVFLIVFSFVTTDTSAFKAETGTKIENKKLKELREQNNALLEKINALEQANAELSKLIYEIEADSYTEKRDDPYYVTEGSDNVNKPLKHVVSEGETLWKIANKYLGDGNEYPKIAKDNKIDDVDLILNGQELIIKK